MLNRNRDADSDTKVRRMPGPAGQFRLPERWTRLTTSAYRRRGWLSARWLRGPRALAPHARQHLSWLIRGLLAAVLIVGLRLALPWPLRAVMEPFLSGQADHPIGALSWIPQGINPVIVMGAAFLLLLVALGYADLLERICFSRFAIGTVRDLRADAFKSMVHSDPLDRAMGSGEVVARLIGDTARIKVGLRGFLVHVATNGIMYVGVTVVLFLVDRTLAMVFAAGGLIVVTVTIVGLLQIRRQALKHRKKEGKLAETIVAASSESSGEAGFAKVNRSSGHHEVTLVKLQGRTTWLAHGIFGVAVFVALWMGTSAVSSGRMSGGDLFVFIAYALMVQRPTIQLSRQGARTGKVLACAERVAKLSAASKDSAGQERRLEPLDDRLELRGVSMRRKTKQAGYQDRLSEITFQIERGDRVLLVGAPGSGKTTLLELMAGVLRPTNGEVLWDGRALAGFSGASRSEQIGYLPHEPTWQRRSVKELLNLCGEPLDGAAEDRLLRCGVRSTIDRLGKGLESKVGSDKLSSGERKMFALARILLGTWSVWLLDDFTAAIPDSDANEFVRMILGFNEGATIVVACQRPVAIACFDRVIELERGRVLYDGPPSSRRACESMPT